MFKLRCVAPFDVAEWGVGVHNADVAKILQGDQVFGLSQAVQPATAEGQGAKILVDHIQELLGFGNSEDRQRRCSIKVLPPSMKDECSKNASYSPDGNVTTFEILHVVRSLHVIMNVTFACAAESLNGIEFSFLANSTNQ